jgi:DNA-binding protein
MSNTEIIFVGKKPTMNYVLTTVTAFNAGVGAVMITARGRSINKAVDVAEIVRSRFNKDVTLGPIKIGTDTIKTEDGKTVNVSSIEITLEG